MNRSLLLSGTLFLLVSILFVGCDDSPTFRDSKKRIGSPVVGEVGELLVVCDQTLWESDFKEQLDTNLTQFIMPYFPDVPTFLLKHKTPKQFEEGTKKFRNILFIELDPNFNGKHASLEYRESVWALDQLVIDIKAKDPNQLETFGINNGFASVHAKLDYWSWKRLLNNYQETSNPRVEQELEKNFGIALKMPKHSKLVNMRPNFFRIDFPLTNQPIEFSNAQSQDRGNVFSGVMVYQYDFVDSTQFTLENLLMARDTMLKYNAPYQVAGMYMGTQYTELVYPEGNRATSVDGSVNGFDIRGMFTYVGLPMRAPGGAFWSFHFKHTKRNKLICISGFLDAPHTANWVGNLREIEAVLRSVKLVD